MDSEEVIFVQEKRKYRRKKGCSVMPLPKKAKKPSPKMEAAAKTTRKYTKKALILKKEVSAVVKPPSKKASGSGPLLLQNYLKEVVPIHTQAAQYTYGGVAPAPTFPPPARVQQGCNHCCVHQQMIHHHHHHPPPPPPSNYYPHPFISQLQKPSTMTSSYSGMAFPGVPCYRKVFEEDTEYTQELEKLLFSCSSWSMSSCSASDLWHSEEHLQYLLSEHGLDEVSTFNTATPSFRQIFGRMDERA